MLVDVNDAPTLITLTKDSVAENQSGAIGMLSSIDEDDEDRIMNICIHQTMDYLKFLEIP